MDLLFEKLFNTDTPENPLFVFDTNNYKTVQEEDDADAEVYAPSTKHETLNTTKSDSKKKFRGVSQ